MLDVVSVLPELLRRMRRMSTPNFSVRRPRVRVRLSMYENAVPTSVSRDVSLRLSNGPAFTDTGPFRNPSYGNWRGSSRTLSH